NPADSPTDSERMTALYMARKRQPKRIFQLFVFKAVFESLIQASIIFYMAIYSIQKLSSQDGLNSSLEVIGREIFYGMTVISNIWVRKFSFLLPYQTFPKFFFYFKGLHKIKALVIVLLSLLPLAV